MPCNSKCLQARNVPWVWPLSGIVGLGLGLYLGPLAAQTAYEIACQPGSVCRELSTALPLRALPRPFSPIYKSKDARDDNILVANVKAFSPVYVFAREDLDYANPADPKGWYQVGATVRQPLGWMQARDLMEWRQALVVSYTHPGTGGEDDRKRVLMFNTQEALETVLGAEDRVGQVNQLYAQVQQGHKPDTLISMEPKDFLNIENTFYILPVVGYKVETRFDDETRLLRIAAAVPGQRATPGNETTLQNQGYLKEQVGTEEVQLQGDLAKQLTADIVFVMDLTGSMGPYVELTKQAIMELAKGVIADPEVSKAVRFGFVGYRDSIALMPKLEFTAKNFTPDLLENTPFVDLVTQQVSAAKVTSDDYTEEVYAGVKEALNTTRWRDGLRFMVLVGDASAHEPDHPQSTTKLDAPRVRSLADEANAYAFAIHLRDPQFNPDWPTAEQQFGAIATNKGTDRPALFGVDVTKPEEFQSWAQLIAGEISQVIKQAQQTGKVEPRTLVPAPRPAEGTAEPAPVDGADGQPVAAPAPGPLMEGGPGIPLPAPLPDEGIQDVRQVIAAALVDYLGSKEGKPPRDFTAWAMDRDLLDPRIKSLDVRLLISRDDLSNLILAVERVTDALATAELTQMKFFESLKAIITQGVKGQTINFDKARTLAEAKLAGEEKLLPKWLEGLPYRSAIQDMSDEKFEAMTPTERSELDRGLRAKLQFYKEISEKVDAWQALNEQDKDVNASKVYPLKLDDLP